MIFDASSIRCHFLVRSLVYWARTKHQQEFKNTHYDVKEVPFTPDFWLNWSRKKLYIVDRPIFKQVCVQLLLLTEPEDLARLYFTPVWFMLEGLEPQEQARCLQILKEHYGNP